MLKRVQKEKQKHNMEKKIQYNKDLCIIVVILSTAQTETTEKQH